MTKTSWQTGYLSMNEDLANLAGEIWEEDILIAEVEELEKIGRVGNSFSKN